MMSTTRPNEPVPCPEANGERPVRRRCPTLCPARRPASQIGRFSIPDSPKSARNASVLVDLGCQNPFWDAGEALSYPGRTLDSVAGRSSKTAPTPTPTPTAPTPTPTAPTPSTLDPDRVLGRFSDATRAWFTTTFDAPTSAQTQGWDAISKGQHTLVLAPTGSGKTLAAFLWALD